MTISNSTAADLETIFEFYDYAVQHQKKMGTDQWKGFDVALVKEEIADSRQYKIEIDSKIVGVFLVSFNDPQIWQERSNDKAIYLHRIVTHPDYRGLNLVQHITNWAIEFVRANKLNYVRMDTWANNKKLVNYYKSFGYQDAGTIEIAANSGLPKHYEGITLQLFELEVAEDC
jgi:ribosomal protein S18 acetylase RimI-like enzyme